MIKTSVAFPQPLYARSLKGEQLIVLGMVTDDLSMPLKYVVMFNDPTHEKRGMSFVELARLVKFEHFYWPEIEPSDLNEHEHPQEPALIQDW